MPSMKEFSTWLTPTEAGREIGISKQALYRHLHAGRFRAVDTRAGWLIDPASAEKFKRERERRLAEGRRSG